MPPPQPRVPITNLVLRDVHSVDSLLSPGLLNCADVTGTNYTPCSGWTLDNVTMTSLSNWPLGAQGYMCSNVLDVTVTGGSLPVPNCVVNPNPNGTATAAMTATFSAPR